VMDKICVYIKDNDVIKGIAQKYKEQISSEVLAQDIILEEMDGYEKEWNINSEKVTMAVKKL